MRYYNLKLIGLLISFVVFTIGLATSVNAVAIPAGIVAAVLFISVVAAQGAIGRANAAYIKVHYDAYAAALKAAQTAAATDLQGADPATVAAVTNKLIEAGKYMGSNPAWRNSRTIITASDLGRWYIEGKRVSEEASALIASYKNSRQS